MSEGGREAVRVDEDVVAASEIAKLESDLLTKLAIGLIRPRRCFRLGATAGLWVLRLHRLEITGINFRNQVFRHNLTASRR
jgi:hypothetical protein